MIQAVLNKLFNKVDIKVNGDPGAPIYLRRWFIWPRKPQDNKMVSRIYLHRFFTGDNVRDLHDHPWSFRSIILWGGYWEHSYNPVWLKWQESHKLEDSDRSREREIKSVGRYWAGNTDAEESELKSIMGRNWVRSLPEPEKTIKKWYGPGSFLKRGAAWTHAVELKKDKHGKDVPCWSLVRTGIKSRSWGFHTEGGWCHWKNYHSGACVCYDNPNEDIPGATVGKDRKERAESQK